MKGNRLRWSRLLALLAALMVAASACTLSVEPDNEAIEDSAEAVGRGLTEGSISASSGDEDSDGANGTMDPAAPTTSAAQATEDTTETTAASAAVEPEHCDESNKEKLVVFIVDANCAGAWVHSYGIVCVPSGGLAGGHKLNVTLAGGIHHIIQGDPWGVEVDRRYDGATAEFRLLGGSPDKEYTVVGGVDGDVITPVAADAPCPTEDELTQVTSPTTAAPTTTAPPTTVAQSTTEAPATTVASSATTEDTDVSTTVAPNPDGSPTSTEVTATTVAPLVCTSRFDGQALISVGGVRVIPDIDQDTGEQKLADDQPVVQIRVVCDGDVTTADSAFWADLNNRGWRVSYMSQDAPNGGASLCRGASYPIRAELKGKPGQLC